MPLAVFSQGKMLSGTVNDDMGNPLPGATVQVKGSESIGSITDFDGNFTITLKDNATKIIVSYVGFVDQEVDVANQSNITVSLSEDVSELDEVVVIGYGTVLKKDITGSVSSVKVSETISRQSTTVDQLLQGRAAGVTVAQNAANPGAGISVRVRGTSSLRGNNEPLYVVDGIIISSAGEDVVATGGGNTGQEQQNGLNGINPRDIEDIQVLKDASATAIYGSRGANGVILITTKKGTPNQTKSNIFINTSMRSITKQYDVLDGLEYARYRNESILRTTTNQQPQYHIEGNNIYPFITEDGVTTIANVPALQFNWQEELFRTFTSLSVGGSVSGGSDNGNYYLSAGMNDQTGLAKNSSFNSGDIRLNLNQNLSSKIKLQTRLSGFFSKTDFAEGGDLIGGSNQSFIRNAISFRPLLTPEDSNIQYDDLETSNPLSWIDDYDDLSNENRFFGSLALTFDLGVKGLSYQVKAGGNIRSKERRRFFGLTTFQGVNSGGLLQIMNLKSTSYQVNNTFQFNRSFRKQRINAVVGITYDRRENKNTTYAVQDFVSAEKRTEQPFLGQLISSPLSNLDTEQTLFSFLGRATYSLNNKYVLTASFRRDGVSKFLESERYGFFPSGAFSWNLDRESFIKKLNVFDQLKLRIGWGQIGNHGIGAYGTLSNYGINSSVLYGNVDNGTSVPLLLNNIANASLTWETTEQSNIGLDFSLLDGTITGTVDAYDKRTKDLLLNSQIAPSTGFQSLLVNRGELSNKGLEVALQFSPIAKEDFQLSFGGNVAFNRTRIEALPTQPLAPILLNGSYVQRRFVSGNAISRGNHFKYPANIFIEGEESAVFYGYQTDGIYQEGDTFIGSAQAGDIKIIDQNGDGAITNDDRTVIGNPNPDYTFGFNLSVTYKQFTLSALLNGVYGNDIVNGNLLQLGNAEGLSRNILKTAYHNAWRPERPSNSHPRIGYSVVGNPEETAISDRFVEDGSFLRLNNITLGYDIPIKGKSPFKGANIYLTGQNLLTFTNYSGYDPEITSFMWTGLITGVDWNGPPNARNFLLGLNLNL